MQTLSKSRKKCKRWLSMRQKSFSICWAVATIIKALTKHAIKSFAAGSACMKIFLQILSQRLNIWREHSAYAKNWNCVKFSSLLTKYQICSSVVFFLFPIIDRGMPKTRTFRGKRLFLKTPDLRKGPDFWRWLLSLRKVPVFEESAWIWEKRLFLKQAPNFKWLSWLCCTWYDY